MDTNKLRFLSSLVDNLENEGNIIEASKISYESQSSLR